MFRTTFNSQYVLIQIRVFIFACSTICSWKESDRDCAVVAPVPKQLCTSTVASQNYSLNCMVSMHYISSFPQASCPPKEGEWGWYIFRNQAVLLHDVESKPLLYWEFPGSRDSQFPSYLTGYVKKQVPVIYKCCYSTGVSCKMESCFLTGFHFTVLYLYFNSI